MNIVIIKYNAGNIFSVEHAFKRLGIKAVVSSDHDLIRSADKVVFPGVGEASSTMQYLQQSGLDKLIPNLSQPVLGICLGMQLMCSHSEEGDVNCLNIFDAEVKRFIPQKHEDKVPHMGWNIIKNVKSEIFDETIENQFVYFVHSYYVALSKHTIATTDYIQPFSAAIHKDNFYATQFHPEKSGSIGEKILINFLSNT
ncbi:imidazole glycerol phosphate synthase subunit HisH [Dysgonomonas sp. Marseille-P4677]|uniref:imidazole glycerol phosphate synthase subunit HisH n=1 Tax=Dysgonomonas sp. Marseille-P4677 TaxID=2364790 RepID=UPI0019148F0A|nr:imidazole glycerol phosphate synthase subunit HisH [Dysgonomonas sp. Marseille-P4677]MBK5722658.1 imidazole glycerol phosphate synthase subunit HisH [Dysgonomonas sp. Marseille-P4677]